mmetsp:Transcript_137678/g.348853  ORF Transcript_137678/g.348853 Transcript_137678/m.348853 type:complete len:958 (+) Transcript_137678:80-2953(+)
MNAGAPVPKRPAIPATRPRSPEGKAPANRARSPALKPTAADRRSSGGQAPGLVGSTGAVLTGTNIAVGRSSQPQPAVKRGTSSTVEEIKRIDMNREQRRRAAEELRKNRQEEAALLGAQCGGSAPDIDFHRMIRDFRQQCPAAATLDSVNTIDSDGIIVCVRKRPIQQHELANRDLDCVTACNPFAIVHERKYKVDGITKCLESHQFEFDKVFDEEASTNDVYTAVAQPLVPWVLERGGRATLFAYGQTGSGKTHTMTGIQRLLADQLFDHVRRRVDEPIEISISFFEIYGGRPYDLLNNRQRLETLEDARNEVQIAGLTERPVTCPESMLQCIDLGNSLRTTHATAINRDSSRSHAVCAVFLRLSSGGAIHAKITLVDLAGSERAADSKSSIRQRRVEGAQINKSLLALKECIRAMGDPREAHVPFRASKLTLVLRDAFVSRCPSRTVMIACISPGIASADHSVNTLRYSDRLKDHPRVLRVGGDQRHGPDDSIGESSLERGCRRNNASLVVPARESKSPEPRQASRRRSPSPSMGAVELGMLGPLSSGTSVPSSSALASSSFGVVKVHKEDELADRAESDADDESRHTVDDELPPPVAVAVWEESAQKGSGNHYTGVPDGGRGAGAVASMPACGGRQSVPRRGRQPTLGNKAGAPHRPDALGSRVVHGDAAAGRAQHAAPAVQPQQTQSSCSPPILISDGAGTTVVLPTVEGKGSADCAASDVDGAVAAAAVAAAGGGAHGQKLRERSQPRSVVDPAQHAAAVGGVRSGSDLRQQDNRYLHNTLTSEVFERGDSFGGGASIVDVGVQDLTDLAHMEVLDEVRQWEDRIVSQHMVALQEDARLLTAESELLSQVQQGASYDIDWYVSEVDKVVRRKMEVYAGFLEDLEVFKAQLRREESLSRSCQRGRGGHALVEAAATGICAAVGEAVPMDLAPSRTPRTPRSLGAASVPSLHKE